MLARTEPTGRVANPRGAVFVAGLSAVKWVYPFGDCCLGFVLVDLVATRVVCVAVVFVE